MTRSRPEWWDRELEITPHAWRRILERGLLAVDLRAMMADDHGAAPDPRPGRWQVESSAHGVPWCIVVEPDPTTRTLVVVTAFRR